MDRQLGDLHLSGSVLLRRFVCLEEVTGWVCTSYREALVRAKEGELRVLSCCGASLCREEVLVS
jgi:hypothetical protein